MGKSMTINYRHLTALAIAVLANAALWGCERQITDYPQQPELVTKGANHKELLVHFRDVADFDTLQMLCQGKADNLKYACADYYPPSDPAYPDRALVIVWQIPPRDFNHAPALSMLGHEILHGRGWRHK
jgi:hypothetical protein